MKKFYERELEMQRLQDMQRQAYEDFSRSFDGGAEGTQPPEVEGAESRGACLRIYGKYNGRLGVLWRGMVRAKANIALTNIVYNMCRLVQIKKYQPILIAVQ